MNLLHLHYPLLRQSAAATFVAAVTATGLLLAAGPVAAVETRDAAGPVAIKSGAGTISKEQATQNALTALPGTVTDVSIEKKRGKNVWVIEIVAEKTGVETDVLVDIDSGTVIGMED